MGSRQLHMSDTIFRDEATLIAGLVKQDEAAFRYAIRTFGGPMQHLAASIVGQKIADEVVQEAWFSVLKSVARFEGRSALKTWIMRITANEAKTRLRREKRNVALEDLLAEDESFADRFDGRGHWTDAPTQWGHDSPDELLASEELGACINRMIDQLPDLQSATLTLRERQGLSLAEICNILDVSESNVRVLLHRARNKVLGCVEHFQQTGECLAAD